MYSNRLYNKIIIFGIIILLTGTCIIPATGNIIQKQTLSDGQLYLENTIYVDDDNTEGPWDGTLEHPYQYIQDGINASDEGYTVYVFSGTYHENIIIDKPIYLIGEDNEWPVVDGSRSGNCVQISRVGVTIQNFMIQNSSGKPPAGIYVNSDHVTISNNVIWDNGYGIILENAKNNKIFQNDLMNEHGSIVLIESDMNKIYENFLHDHHGCSLGLGNSYNNQITSNWFHNNTIHALCTYGSIISAIAFRNNWNGNYWDEPKLLHPISSFIQFHENFFLLPWINFDWKPLQEIPIEQYL